jgi:hypothetical protein
MAAVRNRLVHQRPYDPRRPKRRAKGLTRDRGESAIGQTQVQPIMYAVGRIRRGVHLPFLGEASRLC